MQHYVFSWNEPNVACGQCSVVAASLEEAQNIVNRRFGPSVEIWYEEMLTRGNVHVVTTDRNPG